MNTPSSPSLLTPTRLVKHKDKLVSLPVSSPRTVDNIFINDLQGFDSIVSSIIQEKEKSGITSAMKLLENYKFFYNLSNQEIQNFAYLTGIVAPYDSNKLSTIEADIYKIIFPKFTRQYQDLIELTKENWINWKISILKDYIKNGVNDSNHKFLDSIKKDKKKITAFNETIDKLIIAQCFDDTVKFNPFIGFSLKKNLKGLVIIYNNEIKIRVDEDEYLPIGQTYQEIGDDKLGVVRLTKHLASLLLFVDSVLNKCILKFMNENGMSYLDEYKPTSFSDGFKKPSSSISKPSSISDKTSSISDKTSMSDGSKKKMKKSVKKSPMSKKKSRKNKIKNNIIINNVTTK